MCSNVELLLTGHGLLTIDFLTPQTDDTIAALASPPGPASRGIVRVSGPQTKEIVASLFVPTDAEAWEDAQQPWRHPGVVSLPDVHSPRPVNVLLWPTTRSYTGQPTAEIHMVGSPPLLEAVLRQLFAEGARPAQRGEFTLRAFLAGRLDLMQAEAVLGVIDATDQQQLSTALDQLGGGLSQRIATLHEELLLHLADLEAGLDFVEDDIEFVSREQLNARLQGGIELLSGLMSQSSKRLQSTGRRKVVLAGLPNAGKSTLLNALCDEQAAIVSQTAGTTRDYLSVPLDWEGLAIELIDTAGWDQSGSDDEVQSITRNADKLRDEQWQRADLILWCTAIDISQDDAVLDTLLREESQQNGQLIVHLTTKADLSTAMPGERALPVSASTGAGLEAVRTEVSTQLQTSGTGNHILGTTTARCQDSLRGANDALTRARAASASMLGDELIVVELREAIDHLGQIAGRVFTDDILDRIFSRFCIGK